MQTGSIFSEWCAGLPKGLSANVGSWLQPDEQDEGSLSRSRRKKVTGARIFCKASFSDHFGRKFYAETLLFCQRIFAHSVTQVLHNKFFLFIIIKIRTIVCRGKGCPCGFGRLESVYDWFLCVVQVVVQQHGSQR